MSLSVASSEERYALDDALIASYSRRYRVEVKGQSDDAKFSFKYAAVSSTGQRNGRCQLSRWGCEAKSFSRAGIKLKCDSV
jgi:hypothetical protein